MIYNQLCKLHQKILKLDTRPYLEHLKLFSLYK